MNKIYRIAAGFVASGVLIGCAKIGTIPGGPKDEDAPVVVKSKPGNYSTDYSSKNIVIKFDEYVTLKDAFTQFTVSPPLENTPVPYTRGKGVVIEFPSNELDTFTYTLDFGQSIADNNEGNTLPNFQFVVSKQAHIDSFTVSGSVLDAFTLKPDKDGMFVYLNRNLSDTVPYTTNPSYLGKTNPKGKFKINHIAPGTYQIYVIKDANANMIYDMPSEMIAFADDFVTLHPDSFPVHVDTIPQMLTGDSTISDKSVSPAVAVIDTMTIVDENDTISLTVVDKMSSDSTVSDSIEFMIYGYAIDLFAFTELEPYNQYLVEYKRTAPEQIQIVFNEPTDSLPGVELLNPDTTGDWYILEPNITNDTLIYWLADSNMVNQDSVVMALSYYETDTLGILQPMVDTLLFRSKTKRTGTGNERRRGGGLNLPFGQNKDEEKDTLPEPKPRVKFTNNIKKNGHDLIQPIEIYPAVPVFDYNPDLIEFMRLEDTIEYKTDFTFKHEKDWYRKALIEVEFEPFTDYLLKIHEGAFTDIYGRTIDSTQIRFTTQRDDYYGIVEIELKGVKSPVILQLLDDKENVVQYVELESDQRISFEYLHPATYGLKVIFDDNRDGKWNTGKLSEKLQPEKVLYFPQKLEVRSNWTVDYEWLIDKTEKHDEHESFFDEDSKE